MSSEDESFIPDDPAGLPEMLVELQNNFQSHITKDVAFRKEQLRNLIRGHQELKLKIAKALEKDIGWSEWLSEMFSSTLTDAEMTHQLDNIDCWTKKETVPTPLTLGFAKCYIVREPLGVALVLAAWNYSIYTALPFVAAAMAAGNCVVLKPSELAPHSSHVLKELFDKYLDPRFYRCVEGKVEIAKSLTNAKYDLILFTGSTRTGKMVAQAAANNLVPCILELGGKCPVVVDESCNLDSSIKRIALAKFGNCGQTCVSADHIFVHKNIKAKFQARMVEVLKEFYGSSLDTSTDMGRIINKTQLNRLEGILKENHGGNILAGGQIFHDKLFVQPTIIDSPNINSSLMTEEIFGPILPICEYSSLQELIKYINSKPKPLALYCFSENSQVASELKDKTSSGAFVQNDAVMYLANNDLPFGGVGQSGYGRYHGKSGFDSCSNLKSVVESKCSDPFPVSSKFPPYTEANKVSIFKFRKDFASY